METQSVINAAFTVLGLLLGAILKAVWDAVKDLQAADKALTSEVGELQVLVAGKYVTWDGLKDVMEPIKGQLNRIESKLDLKADKASCPAVVHQ